MTHPLARLAGALAAREVRSLLIGVSGANFYGPAGQAVFMTDDIDLFLPLDVENLVRAGAACAAIGLELRSGLELLEDPRDRWLAERVIARRALPAIRHPISF